MTLPEMDMAAVFFIMLSALFLFSFIEDYRRKNLVISAVFMGLAVMIKIYAIFFALGFFLFIAVT
jgi:uncharacterized membrane protein